MPLDIIAVSRAVSADSPAFTQSQRVTGSAGAGGGGGAMGSGAGAATGKGTGVSTVGNPGVAIGGSPGVTLGEGRRVTGGTGAGTGVGVGAGTPNGQINNLPRPQLPLSTYRDGVLLRARSATTIYVMENGRRRAIPDEATFCAHGWRFENVRIVSEEELSRTAGGGCRHLQPRPDSEDSKEFSCVPPGVELMVEDRGAEGEQETLPKATEITKRTQLSL